MVKVGYTSGGGSPGTFSGYVAFTIPDSEYSLDELIPITFEYGHDYDFNIYTTMITHVFEVFVAPEANNLDQRYDYLSLYRFEVEDFVSEEYRCEINHSIINSEIVFNHSVLYEVDPTIIPYDIGVLYFIIDKGIKTDEYTPQRRGVSIYFVKTDKTITFTMNNPFVEE